MNTTQEATDDSISIAIAVAIYKNKRAVKSYRHM